MDNGRLIHITDADDPRLWPYTRLKERQLVAPLSTGGVDPSGAGLFIAEGHTVVELLAASRFAVHSALLVQGRMPAAEAWIARLDPAVPIYVAPQEVMDHVVGFHVHRGVLACGVRSPQPSMGAILASATSAVVLEDLSNTENVGAIFRTVAALGGACPAVLLTPGCADPLYRQAIRVSMGHVLRVPFNVVAPWPGGLEQVSRAGLRLVALAPSAGLDLAEYARSAGTARHALILGSEGPGLSASALRTVDSLGGVRLRIPMADGVDSLNVNAAAAVALSWLSSSTPPGARHSS